MNNDTNQVMGIGVIRNVRSRYSCKIHAHSDYNRHIYRGHYWLPRSQISPAILETLDTILFKGKSHMKCRLGITILSDRIFRHWPQFDFYLLKARIQLLFVHAFREKK